MRQLRQRERALVVVGLLAVVGAGCVKPGPPGVDVAPLKADVVFGVKEPAPAASPANFDVARPQELFNETPETFDEVFNEKVLEIPDITPISRDRFDAKPDPCPPAALTAFPKETADVAIKGTPEEGVYRFKRKVQLTPPEGGPLTSEGFQQHAIRNVRQNPSKSYEFTYEVVQPDVLEPGTVVVTSFRVNSNPTVLRSVNQPPQTIGVVPVPGAEEYITPPNDEPGIFVDKIEKKDRNGGTLGTFQPQTPLLYLPLEEGILKAGQTFDTVGIDPRNSAAIRHRGTVVRKTRVDACGEIVEGWLVEAVQTRTDQNLGDRKYFYNIATQFGGMFIAEAIELAITEGTVAVDLSIANPTPQPLPDNLK